MDFSEFMKTRVDEAVLDVDTSDPVSAAREVQKKARMLNRNPDRFNRDALNKAIQNNRDAKKKPINGPLDNIERQIAQTREKLARLIMRRDQMKKSAR